MKKYTAKFLFWAPRIFTILFALFLSIFAADVFSSGYEWWKIPVAFFMHLIPSILVIVILVISWKREWVGGILYVALGVYYIIISGNKLRIDVFFLIPFPLFAAGTLFLIGWFNKKKEINS